MRRSSASDNLGPATLAGSLASALEAMSDEETAAAAAPCMKWRREVGMAAYGNALLSRKHEKRGEPQRTQRTQRKSNEWVSLCPLCSLCPLWRFPLEPLKMRDE